LRVLNSFGHLPSRAKTGSHTIWKALLSSAWSLAKIVLTAGNVS